MSMAKHQHDTTRVGLVALAPVAMLGALIYHPYIPRLNNDAAVAAELAADPTRWGLSHLAVGVAAALLLLALLVVVAELRAAGEQVWTAMAAPFVVLGSILFAFLPAMEIGALAVHEAGGDVPAVLAEMGRWFVPILVAGSAAFAVGVLALAAAVVRSGLLARGTAGLVAAALAVLAGARFAPFGVALYVGGAAGIAALWPLAAHLWGRTATTRVTRSPAAAGSRRSRLQDAHRPM
jgi:hypothetical protein